MSVGSRATASISSASSFPDVPSHWRRPGIHNPHRSYGFRTRSLHSRSGMTVDPVSGRSQLRLVAGHDFGLAFRLAQFGLVVDHLADAGKNRAFDPRLLRPQFCAPPRLAPMETGFVHI